MCRYKYFERIKKKEKKNSIPFQFTLIFFRNDCNKKSNWRNNISAQHDKLVRNFLEVQIIEKKRVNRINKQKELCLESHVYI